MSSMNVMHNIDIYSGMSSLSEKKKIRTLTKNSMRFTYTMFFKFLLYSFTLAYSFYLQKSQVQC